MKFLKRHAYALLFTLFLMGANVYSLLKVFVIPSQSQRFQLIRLAQAQLRRQHLPALVRSLRRIRLIKMTIWISKSRQVKPVIPHTMWQISSFRVQITLKRLWHKNTYGTNITDTTSSIAQQNNAIFAINGDYYGANQSGYVIKKWSSLS